MENDRMMDKMRGSLVGGACGDALGYPVEFVFSFAEIKEKYGDNGITEYDRDYPWINGYRNSDKALVSDDTQMTLYTAEALVESVRNGLDMLQTMTDAYLAWYGGQTGEYVDCCYCSKLSEIKELNQRRAPGNTCLSSLAAIIDGRNIRNDSKGCGGIMRVAPIGLYEAAHGWMFADTARTAGEVAEITHHHPLSTYSSAALAVIVQQCATTDYLDANGFIQIVERSIEVVESVYGENAPYMKKFIEVVKNPIDIYKNPLEDWEIIEQKLGGGWVAEETLAIAIFSVLRHTDDFASCLTCAVNHGGDSDSTGVVAGNIIGAIIGYNKIPQKFTDTIQFKELLISHSDALL